MGRLLRRMDAFWYMAASAARLAHVRFLVGGFSLVYLLVAAPTFLAVATYPSERFAPLGLVTLLHAPLPGWAVSISFAVTLLAGAAFTLGLHYRWSGPAFAALFLLLTSYRTSWGMCFHTDNLMALHLLLLGMAPAADELSLDARAGRMCASSPGELASHGRYGWSLRAACVITVLTYTLAGVAKVTTSGWAWADGAVLQSEVAMDNLRKIELGAMHSPLGAWLVPHRTVFAPLAALTLLLELGASAALLGGRVARTWIVLAILFHWGVLALMAIVFAYPLTGVAFVTFLHPESWPALDRVRRGLARAPRPTR